MSEETEQHVTIRQLVEEFGIQYKSFRDWLLEKGFLGDAVEITEIGRAHV